MVHRAILSALLLLLAIGVALSILVSLWWLILVAIAGVLLLIAAIDVVQTKHSILRNYPLLGYFRFAFEKFGPRSSNISSSVITTAGRTTATPGLLFMNGPRALRAKNRSGPSATSTRSVTNFWSTRPPQSPSPSTRQLSELAAANAPSLMTWRC